VKAKSTVKIEMTQEEAALLRADLEKLRDFLFDSKAPASRGDLFTPTVEDLFFALNEAL